MIPSKKFATTGILSVTFFVLPSIVESFASLSIPSVTTGTGRSAVTTTCTMTAATINDEILDKLLKVAIDASKQAGDIIIGNAGGAEVTERKANTRDLLTLIDPLCEKVRVQYAVLAGRIKLFMSFLLYFSSTTIDAAHRKNLLYRP